MSRRSHNATSTEATPTRFAGSIIRRFRAECRRLGILTPGSCSLVACSGGPDSAALLDLAVGLTRETDARIRVAHFDHSLRPESAGEAEAVGQMAHKYGVPFITGQAGAEIAHAPDGLHAAGRRLRYRFLTSAAREWLAEEPEASNVAILLGHQQDDQIETVLMRLLAGSGVEGLGGMAEQIMGEGDLRIRLVRPLLSFRREELEAYCRERGLAYFTDPSNDESRYPRSALRKKIIPLLEAQFGPVVRKGILRSAGLIREAGSEMARMIDEAEHNSRLDAGPGCVTLDYVRYASYYSLIRQGLLQRAVRQLLMAGRSDAIPLRIALERCQKADAAILTGRRGPTEMGGGVGIIRSGSTIRIYLAPVEWREALLRPGEKFYLPDGSLIIIEQVAAAAVRLPPVSGELVIDGDGLPSEGLLIRPARPGDRMLPLGAGHPCRVSDLLRAAGVPLEQRRTAPVLIVGSDIAALPPYRIGEHFQLRAATRRALLIRLERRSQADI